MTIAQWTRGARQRLALSGCPDADLDARLLACAALGARLDEIRLIGCDELTDAQLTRVNALLKRREAGEPLQYIEGAAYFMSLKLKADARALIPRQDTETLCEAALEFLKPLRAPGVLDLCTGGGALAIAIARFRPDARVTATDISARALELARENALMNGVAVNFLEGDAFTPVKGMRFDVIVCNPPYLSREDMVALQAEARREPAISLFGGADGLSMYRKIAPELPAQLNAGGCALFEVGAGQADAVERLCLNSLPGARAGYIKDLCGIDRVVWVRS